MSEPSATPLTSVLLLSSGYRAIVDNISDAAWLKDRLGRYAHVNERFLSFHGLSLDAVIGKKDEEVFPGIWRTSTAEMTKRHYRLVRAQSLPSP